jgi:hypothetical protein
VAEWQMNGASIASSEVIGSITSDWSVAGIGDFNGDGMADVLWRNSTGSLAEWQMNGDSYTPLSVANVGTAWSAIGVGDYNGDGKADILWQNTDGTVAEWQMSGASITSSAVIGSVSSDWTAQKNSTAILAHT